MAKKKTAVKSKASTPKKKTAKAHEIEQPITTSVERDPNRPPR
jgi:hypothetical protein